jgi:3-oxoacyl-[acyl-carrier-protein] synthase II
MPTQSDSVSVTGIGAITPLGETITATWDSMLKGHNGAQRLTDPWAAELPVRIAAKAAADPAHAFTPLQARRLDRSAQFALLAVREAWADAGFTGPADTDGAPAGDRVATAIGSGLGGVSALLDRHDRLDHRDDHRPSPFTVPMLMVNSPSAHVSLAIGARAGAHAPATACAAGAEAIMTGLDMIRAGRADVVVAGGTEAMINALAISAFANIRAMSCSDDPDHASRPFDKGRDGFVMGEGAAVLVLESTRHARARGARIYCDLAGAGLTSDAHHIARPDPTGRAMAQALRRALHDAGAHPRDVVHINAHATSTPIGDPAESLAITDVFGPYGCPVSAIKSMTGHLIGAAGALAAATSVLSLYHRTAPPTININDLDDAILLDVVRDQPRPLQGAEMTALSSAAGFGGHNVVLAFRKRWDPLADPLLLANWPR